MEMEFAVLVPIVFAIVETIEKLGVKKNIAHLLALPVGIVISFAVIPGKNVFETIVKGILIGFGAIGTCDTICNGKEVMNGKKKGKTCKSGKCGKDEKE